MKKGRCLEFEREFVFEEQYSASDELIPEQITNTYLL